MAKNLGEKKPRRSGVLVGCVLFGCDDTLDFILEANFYPINRGFKIVKGRNDLTECCIWIGDNGFHFNLR